MKKILSLLLIFALLILALPVSAQRTDVSGDRELEFGADGKFRIMLIADMQDNVFPSEFLTRSVAAAINSEKPDLIVLLGDQLEGWYPLFKLGDKEKIAKKTIDRMIAPIVQSGVPFLVTLGNHDTEMGISRDDMMALYKEYPACLNSNEDMGAELEGGGTCNVAVRGSDGSLKLNLYAMDSMDYEGEGYGCVTADQVEWCTAKTAQLAAEAGYTVPAMVFQHIVVGEIYDALTEAPEGTEGSFSGRGTGEGKYFLYGSDSLVSGELNESPCPSGENHGQFEAWVKNGDVFAAFFGHDHTNTFVIPYRGVELVNVPGSTFHNYADVENRGVRMVELTEDNVRDYETRLVRYGDLIDISGPEMIRYRLFCTDEYAQSVVKQAIMIGIVLAVIVAVVVRAAIKRGRKRRNAAK